MAAIDLIENALSTYTIVNPVIQAILVSALILIIGLVAGKLLGKIVRRFLGEFEADKNLKATTGWDFSIEKFASNFVTYFTYFVAVIMALDTIGVTSAVLNMIAGIIVLLLLVSVVLAIKDFVPNMMAGIVMKNKKDFKKGAKIKVKNVEGKIIEVGILETRIKTKGKEIVLVPNSLFTKNQTTIKK